LSRNREGYSGGFDVPSVVVEWAGRCAEAAAQRDVLGRVEEIANISHGLFGAPPTIRRYDHTLEGSIWIRERAFRVEPELAARLERVDDEYLLVPSACLHGIVFDLYDPRDLHDTEVGFVFADIGFDPRLTGILVHPKDYRDPEPWQKYSAPGSDWLLDGCHLHMRYLLETWMDGLLGWIKRYYMPDLWYWRYDDLPNYERYSGESPDDTEARERGFEALKRFLVDVCTDVARDKQIMDAWTDENEPPPLSRAWRREF
jgi:hypothetical protein